MNVALPTATFAAAPPDEDAVLLGMPQLCLSGLSETWLLKELGHRHWLALARLAGRAVPDFRDVDGGPVYAAFRALSVAEADFARLGENDRLAIRSDIRRVSRTQCLSRHRLSCGGRPAGHVELLSAFVRRGPGGGNHNVARVALDGFPAPSVPEASSLAARVAGLRAGRVSPADRFGLVRPAEGPERTEVLEIDPCPAQDFNGAGFLYFSSFVSFLDRAEWHFDSRRAPRAATRAREIHFHGNIDPGDRVVVRRIAARRDADGLAHHCRLERAADGVLLADAFTRRRL